MLDTPSTEVDTPTSPTEVDSPVRADPDNLSPEVLRPQRPGPQHSGDRVQQRPGVLWLPPELD